MAGLVCMLPFRLPSSRFCRLACHYGGLTVNGTYVHD